MCRQIHVLFHSFTSLFDATIYLQDPDQEVHAIEEEVVVEAGCIAKVAQALKDLLLLLYPPLVSRQMQSRRFLCMMIIWVKEAQALDKGTGGTILIEPLLNPLLLNPPPVVKLDAIQEVWIEDSSGIILSLSTHPVIFISRIASKRNVHMGNIRGRP